MRIRTIGIVAMAAMMLMSGCGTMNSAGKGALLGGGGGALLGAGIGALAGGKQGAAWGAAIGAGVGAGGGALIGHKMDKQKAELEKIEGAQVETITDPNGVQGIKVTFADGILFATGKSALNQSSMNALTQFAGSLQSNPQTDISIFGHTDNTGSRAVNEKLSSDRAVSVENYLKGKGISTSRMSTKGCAYDFPIADNSTAAGKAANRRVEIYITANADMIKAAEAGNLK